MLMLEAVPPMNFARIDPGESGDRSVIAPNKILKKINARGRRLICSYNGGCHPCPNLEEP